MSDQFVCLECGNRGYYKQFGDYRTCGECGGTMKRK